MTRRMNINQMVNSVKINTFSNVEFDILYNRAETHYKTFKESKWINMPGSQQMKYIMDCKKETTSLLNELGYFYNYEVVMNDVEESGKTTRLKLEELQQELNNILQRHFKIYHHYD